MNLFLSHRNIIMKHSKNPYNLGLSKIDKIFRQKEFHNLFCGDSITLQLLLTKKKQIIIKHDTQGCLLSLCSASIMSKYLSKKTKQEILINVSSFLQAEKQELNSSFLQEEEIRILQKIASSFPTRKKCLFFPWQALQELLEN